MSDYMDKAKDFAKDNPDKVDQGVDKAGDVAQKKFGDEHAEKIDQAENKVDESIDKFTG